MKKLVLWNDRARRAAGATELRRLIERDPMSRLVETQSKEHAARMARRNEDGDEQLIVAAGGDGTVNVVLQGMLESRTQSTLAILPLGTGNDLSRSLGIPQEPREAWSSFEQLRPKRIDVGRVRYGDRERIFCNSANYGNSSRLLGQLDDEFKKLWGPLAYLRAGLTLLPELVPFEMRIRFNEEPTARFEAYNLIVANGRTAGGGAEIAPRASLSDGLLDVIVISEASFGELASVATNFVLGDYLESDCVTYRRAERVRIGGQHAIPLLVDGEPVEGSEYLLETLPRAARVLADPRLTD